LNNTRIVEQTRTYKVCRTSTNLVINW